jgi:hypothetical protein
MDRLKVALGTLMLVASTAHVAWAQRTVPIDDSLANVALVPGGADSVRSDVAELPAEWLTCCFSLKAEKIESLRARSVPLYLAREDANNDDHSKPISPEDIAQNSDALSNAKKAVDLSGFGFGPLLSTGEELRKLPNNKRD